MVICPILGPIIYEKNAGDLLAEALSSLAHRCAGDPVHPSPTGSFLVGCVPWIELVAVHVKGTVQQQVKA